ncbi:MAG: PQQ-binding-like beta-propeller repeat protein [Pirellulaceae bacterium]
MESFPAEGLKIRWRASVGAGWSSPVIAQGRVFVTDSQIIRPTPRERVHCFEEATGKSLWTYSYDVTYPDWAFVAGGETGPSATPIVDSGKVYTVGGNGHVHCFDPGKGELLWQKDLGKEYEIEAVMCRASPLIEGDLLIVFTGGKPGACVVALDKNSGNEVWKALDESVSNSSPIIIAAGGERQLIVWTQESVTSLAPETGTTYWQQRLLTINDYVVSTPVSHNNLLLIGGLMLELDADKPAASVLWPKSRAVSRRILSNTSTAMFRSDHLFSARSSGELVCLEASTGKQVWETDTVTDLRSGASIHITENDDGVFLFTDKGELIRAQLTAQGYREISRSGLLEPTYAFGGRKVAWTPPAYANRHIFARSDKELICATLAATL